jgi:hypothetical protein
VYVFNFDVFILALTLILILILILCSQIIEQLPIDTNIVVLLIKSKIMEVMVLSIIGEESRQALWEVAVL